MRTLIVGAGATGGYFGAHLVKAGRDVTFLVRPHRAEQLREGLHVHGPGYDETVAVRAITARQIEGPYDLILLMVKAWSLETALQDIAAAVGPDTAILPLLNGVAQLDMLNERFGRDAVLGGLVRVVCTVTADGSVFQMKPHAALFFGEQDKQTTERVGQIGQEMAVPGFRTVMPHDVLASMWHKWAFITAGGIFPFARHDRQHHGRIRRQGVHPQRDRRNRTGSRGRRLHGLGRRTRREPGNVYRGGLRFHLLALPRCPRRIRARGRTPHRRIRSRR